MMRSGYVFFLVGCLVFSLGCEPIQSLEESKSSVSDPESNTTQDWKNTQQVQQDVRRAMVATFEGDVDTLLDLTHEKVLEVVDDPEVAREALRRVLASFQEYNTSMDELEFTAEPYFLESEKSHFVVVPTRMVMTINEKKVEAIGYEFGQKKKTESKWRYIAGKKVNPQTVGELFPDFPSDFQFPEMSMNVL
ncbi:hypothetical protein C5Y97_02745 [Blastopirellula marina]|uniref:Uncharacterized protein n=2 Tax=Blastopirellula marina TaxID=124 RepID=A0A2S8GB69_9BACT|nr:hypothetical protein C5Y98_02745 [Blastopirellula marina]PTL46102.1 hypothetical protein C5Y97_02745 [Blastopirellula marina]